MGLGLELGVRLSLEKGLAAVEEDDVSIVPMTQVFQNARFLGKVGIEMKSDDQMLILKMTRMYREFLGGLGVNLASAVTKMTGVRGWHDGLGDFYSANNYGVTGLLSIETKVFTRPGFRGKYEKFQTEAFERFKKAQLRDPSLGGFMYVAIQVAMLGGMWDPHPIIFAELWQGAEWVTVAGWGRQGRTKTPVQAILAQLSWHRSNGVRYALVSDFLSKASKQTLSNTVGQSVAHWKATLGRAVSFKKLKIVGMCGSKPWVATASTLRKVYARF